MRGGGQEQEEMEKGRSEGEDAGGGGGDFRNGTTSCEEAILSLSQDISAPTYNIEATTTKHLDTPARRAH